MAKSTKVVANLSVAVSTASAYQTGALRTKSDAYFGEYISRANLMNHLSSIADKNNELDYIKKALFYGRNLGEHTPRISHGYNVETTDAKQRDLIHGLIGISTESGEICERLHEVLNRTEAFPLDEDLFTDKDKINLFEELGDVLWYVAIAAEALGVGIDEIMVANLNKLRKRFPEKFTEELANERDIETEQKSLEKDLTAASDLTKLDSPNS